MPSYLQLLRVEAGEATPGLEPALAAARVSQEEDTHTWTTLQEALQTLAGAFPDARARILYSDSIDWLQVALAKLERGTVQEEQVELSLEQEQLRKPGAPPSFEVRLPLSVAADELLDALGGALEDGVSPSSDDEDEDGRTLLLTPEFTSQPAALQALSLLAAHLGPKTVRFVLSAGEEYYEATLEKKKGVTLAPLFPWVQLAADRAFVREAFPVPQAAAFLAAPVIAAKKVSRKDPNRPLTTGSAKSRLDAVHEVMKRKVTEGGISWWVPDEGGLAKLEPALRAPENAGPEFARVREELYGTLFQHAPDRAVTVILERLAEEPEEVRRSLYSHLSNSSSDAAHRRLAQAFREETPELQDRLSRIMWRQRGAVEHLVRGQLVQAWSEEPRLAQRILDMLHSEYIPVERAWLENAPPDLLQALEPSLAAAAE